MQHVYSLIIQFLYSCSCSLGNVAQGHFSTQSLSLFVKVVRGQNILHCEKYVCTFLWALACKYNRVFPNFASRWTSSWAFTDCFMRQAVINEGYLRKTEIKSPRQAIHMTASASAESVALCWERVLLADNQSGNSFPFFRNPSCLFDPLCVSKASAEGRLLYYATFSMKFWGFVH